VADIPVLVKTDNKNAPVYFIAHPGCILCV